MTLKGTLLAAGGVLLAIFVWQYTAVGAYINYFAEQQTLKQKMIEGRLTCKKLLPPATGMKQPYTGITLQVALQTDRWSEEIAIPDGVKVNWTFNQDFHDLCIRFELFSGEFVTWYIPRNDRQPADFEHYSPRAQSVWFASPLGNGCLWVRPRSDTTDWRQKKC